MKCLLHETVPWLQPFLGTSVAQLLESLTSITRGPRFKFRHGTMSGWIYNLTFYFYLWRISVLRSRALYMCLLSCDLYLHVFRDIPSWKFRVKRQNNGLMVKKKNRAYMKTSYVRSFFFFFFSFPFSFFFFFLSYCRVTEMTKFFACDFFYNNIDYWLYHLWSIQDCWTWPNHSTSNQDRSQAAGWKLRWWV